MRQILVDRARSRLGNRVRVALDEVLAGFDEQGLDVIALHEALERLAQEDPRWAQVVDLRFFCGLSVPEVAEMLEVSVGTVESDWRFARAWLADAQDTEAERAGFPAPPTPSGGGDESARLALLRLRGLDVCVLCLHCRNPIELVRLHPDEREVVCPSCGSTFRLERESTALWSPRGGRGQMGRFELILGLGEGTFGTVYKARDLQLDRVVAIKLLPTGSLATDKVRDLLFREARILAQLRHPGIVPCSRWASTKTCLSWSVNSSRA
jgi:hypothetical protein